MRCKRCGKEILRTRQFCPHCGTRLSNATGDSSLENKIYEIIDALKTNVDTAELNKLIDALKTNVHTADLIKYSKLAYLIAAIVAAVSTLLPYVTMSAFGLSITTNFIKAPVEFGGQYLDGVVLVILAIIALVFWKLGKSIAMVVVGAASSCLMIFEISRTGEMMDIIGRSYCHTGLGYKLCCLSAFVMLGSAIVYHFSTRRRSNQRFKDSR